MGALDEHAAEVSGSRPPALNLKERGQARQLAAFALGGKPLRRNSRPAVHCVTAIAAIRAFGLEETAGKTEAAAVAALVVSDPRSGVQICSNHI